MKCSICGTPYASDFTARIGACELMENYTAFYNQSLVGERVRAHNDQEAIEKATEYAERHNETLKSISRFGQPNLLATV